MHRPGDIPEDWGEKINLVWEFYTQLCIVNFLKHHTSSVLVFRNLTISGFSNIANRIAFEFHECEVEFEWWELKI